MSKTCKDCMYCSIEDYGNGEFNSANVVISCKNCGTLHDLGKYMQERKRGVRDE